MLRVGGKTIALATSCSLNTTTQISDSRTKDDANGPSGEFESVDWTASSDNIVGANDNVSNEVVYAQLLEMQLNGTIVELSMDLVLNAAGAIPTEGWAKETATNKAFVPYGGRALIESLNLSAPQEGNATVSINFKAVGSLAKVTA